MDCLQALPREHHACPQCANLLPESTPPLSLCGDCLRWPPAFDRTHAAFRYHGSMRYLITQLKFAAHTKNARLLGQLLAQQLHNHAPQPQVLIPVPLYRKRYRERTFNQSLEIARVLSQQLGIPLALNSCIRQRDTPQQSQLPRQERLKNLHNAFALPQPIAFKHVALVDDVMTTGTTLHELAYLLKKHGVQTVDAWVVARA